MQASAIVVGVAFDGAGAQVGPNSSSAPCATATGPEPSAFITQMSKFAPRSLSKAICVPSGDHTGDSSQT